MSTLETKQKTLLPHLICSIWRKGIDVRCVPQKQIKGPDHFAVLIRILTLGASYLSGMKRRRQRQSIISIEESQQLSTVRAELYARDWLSAESTPFGIEGGS